ncbi:hypothetical protein D9757_006895 [Collybiopsis confluens]|uniref:F-box domain-containing protein n=1 Tax=Collybiopsis confluens TaxID=2823264 RepID=A0A8H5MB76_9AGAR|nr:hypothetical protein D9757_006895 [Collybiopsis confluens]
MPLLTTRAGLNSLAHIPTLEFSTLNDSTDEREIFASTLSVPVMALKAPIRKIPNETLGLIFDYARETNLLQEFPWGLGTDKKPPTEILSSSDILRKCPSISISSTCYRWRQVALARHSMWSRLKLELTSGEDSPMHRTPFTDMLELHLQRSGTSSLQIALNISGEKDQVLYAVTLIVKHSNQWRRFFYGGEVCSSTYYNDEVLEVPHLESIVAPCYDADARKNLVPHKKGTKALRNFYQLSGRGQDHLTLDHIDIYAKGPLDSIFDASPHVATLTLRQHTSTNISTSLQVQKTLNQLTSLNVRVRGDAPVGSTLLETVFLSVIFPSLRKLAITGLAGYSMAWPKCAFNTCLSRSSFSLTKLHLKNIPMKDSELITHFAAPVDSVPSGTLNR